MEVKVYNLIRQTWLKVANNLLMLGLSIFRHKLFDLRTFHNQAHIINLSGIIIYFCGTYYLYAHRNPLKKGSVSENVMKEGERVLFQPFHAERYRRRLRLEDSDT